ncbi:MAG: XrtA-associated tyrosine autokinase [Gammaproteobacteria bacterium]|nr:MAG: XrtA-associated tyrosine autokinase [Gammaproteobacteria bacterium]
MSIFEDAFKKFGKGPDDRQVLPGEDGNVDIEARLEELPDVASQDKDWTRPMPGIDSSPPGAYGKEVVLDLSGLEEAGLVDPRSAKTSRLTEEFRRIKHPLIMHANGKGASIVANANMIMVTSSLASEGKTFTAINLAMSIATEMDKTVLLVDADVAKPDVTARLGVQAEKGLIDVLLEDDLTLPDVLIRTDIPKLTLLPAGRKHVRSTEILASEAMQQLTLELSTRYSDRIVIFDSPPMCLTSEARVLAGLMGQIVLVVEEGKTSQHTVKQALSMLEKNEIVGIVLNKKKVFGRGGEGYYGKYGYYGYG